MDTLAPQTSDRDRAIQAAQIKAIARMQSTPADANSTITTVGRVTEGLTCHVQQGKFTATTDLGRGMGGDAAGPSPGFYARTAIAGCVAIAVKMLAARTGHVFDSVEVTVETDFDDLALFGLGCGAAAPLQTRVTIAVDSPEPRETVEALVAQALEMDPWYLALRDAQNVTPRVVTSARA
ncbi:OsmC family protein [Actibacterium sp. XHP0104]|uniref:OsmC family protein n=1 Tax=Actibacterium sp. XHP0104 TaxID=2984335 RepID=UPI0021E953E3|nr:OsmC family protein [Actibacterium sp. XHP0104]MCV2880403.1 OsmC family protein [Actibacterium sp. XHP0104]